MAALRAGLAGAIPAGKAAGRGDVILSRIYKMLKSSSLYAVPTYLQVVFVPCLHVKIARQ